MMKKVRAFSNRPTKFFGIEKSKKKPSKFVIENSVENVRSKKIPNFLDLIFFIFNWIFNEKIRSKFLIFFDPKNFGRPIWKCSNFFQHKPFWSRFFSKLCRFSWRTHRNRSPIDWERFRGSQQPKPAPQCPGHDAHIISLVLTRPKKTKLYRHFFKFLHLNTGAGWFEG